MPSVPFSSPVEDSVPKVDDTVAVGENLDFQRKWWRFERILWIFFGFVLLCDLSGLFGRGYLAKATRTTPDQTLSVDYERIARASTPSIMTLHFGPRAIRDGKIEIFVSDSVVKQLGAQRIAPQPASSTLGPEGMTYVFPAAGSHADARIQLSPSFPGLHDFKMQVTGGAPIEARIFVVP